MEGERRRHEVGDKVGEWTILSELPRRDIPSGQAYRVFAIAHAPGCGRVRVTFETELYRLHEKDCGFCEAESRRKERFCRFCKTRDPSRFTDVARECKRCERTRNRNGTCGLCGAIRASSRASGKFCPKCRRRERREAERREARTLRARVAALEAAFAKALEALDLEYLRRTRGDRRLRERVEVLELRDRKRREAEEAAAWVPSEPIKPLAAKLSPATTRERVVRRCVVEGCASTGRAHGFCDRHRDQLRRHGEIRPDTMPGHSAPNRKQTQGGSPS